MSTAHNPAQAIQAVFDRQHRVHPWHAPVPHNVLTVPAVSELQLMIQALKAPARRAAPGAALQTLMGLILDESGSMSTGYGQTVDGYNQQLDTIRANANRIGCNVLQVNFSDTARVLSSNLPAHMVVRLSGETYRPGGGTALYDTTVAAIKRLLEHPLAHDDSMSIMLAITTDGDDTSSVQWGNRDGAFEPFRQLLKAVSENERWTVTLSGPDLKLRQFSDEMSVARENISAFKPLSVMSRSMAMGSSVEAMGNFVNLRAAGMKKSEMLYAGTVGNAFAASILDGKDPA